MLSLLVSLVRQIVRILRFVIFYPGVLVGIGLGPWLRVLLRNAGKLRPRNLGMVASVTGCAVFNSVVGGLEQLRFGRRIRQARVLPPIFILGHWRSGTTFLHGLLSVDERFAGASHLEAFCPRTFLSTTLPLRLFMQREGKRLTDNVAVKLESPEEDEFALIGLTGECLLVNMAFPGDPVSGKYLTLEDATPEERRRWGAALSWFYKKLTVKYGRPLILKSPGHTARIQILLDLFPDAKFVFIRRNPYDVIRSSMLAVQTLHAHLGRPELEAAVCRGMLGHYKTLHEAFEKQVGLIPEGRLHRLSFEELETSPLEEVERVYRALDLPDFEVVRPLLEEHVASLKDYKKTSHSELSPELRTLVAQELGAYFKQWGYPVEALVGP